MTEQKWEFCELRLLNFGQIKIKKVPVEGTR